MNRVDIFDQSGALTGWFQPETAQLMIRVAPADGEDEYQELYRIVGDRWVLRTGWEARFLNDAEATHLQRQLGGNDRLGDSDRPEVDGVGAANRRRDSDQLSPGGYQDPTSRLLISSGVAVGGSWWTWTFALRFTSGVAQPYAAIIVGLLWLAGAVVFSIAGILVTGGGPALERVWAERGDAMRARLSRR